MDHQNMRTLIALSLALLLAACAPAREGGITPPDRGVTAAVSIARAPLSTGAPCTGAFVEHVLPFSTGARVREMRTYLSNGAGVAANDLDDDGDIDLLFASVDGPAKILWHDGAGEALSFSEQALDAVNTRMPAIVDIDGDGRLDIVLSHRVSGVTLLRNLGARRFEKLPALEPDVLAYALGWADLDADGRLDMVAASYQAELDREGFGAAEMRGRTGVFVYEWRDGAYRARQLSDKAQALAVGLVDIDSDGRRDIWIGNDFDLPDAVFRAGADGAWLPAAPFGVTSHSTMSIDWADLGTGGGLALYTTDMNPGSTSTQVLARWLPMLKATEQRIVIGDPQISANVLQIRGRAGDWRNDAPGRGIDATGWSWAGRFGDLDNDGTQDLYVVNGMIARDLFGHLPDAALVEDNVVFRGAPGGAFERAPEWNLAAPHSGRGMIPVDIDQDGDLDLVVNNLRGSARLYENRLCGGRGVLIELRQPDAHNTRAIGAWVELETPQGVLRRDIRAASGYLGGDAAQAHFGLPADAMIQNLTVIWSDGARSRVSGINTGERLLVTREP
jgi:enediyne biosynthesis protein E4